MRAGLVDEGMATDISPGMLDVLSASAARLGLEVETAACEASSLPFEDESFDLVVGHAVLHHLPDLDAAFREFRRVLRPGGAVAFCGEPSRYGDRLAQVPKRGAHARGAAVARADRRGRARPRRRTARASEEDQLEQVVDVHAFTPGDLAAHARGAGLERVRVGGEELAATLFGWANRALEATAVPEDIP